METDLEDYYETGYRYRIIMKLAIATGITFLALANPSLSQTELPDFPFRILIDNFHVIEAYRERIPTLIGTANTWAIEDRWLYQEPSLYIKWIRFVDCQTSWGYEQKKIDSAIPGGTPTLIFNFEFPRIYNLSYTHRDVVSAARFFSLPAERKEVYASIIGLDEEIDRRDTCRYMGLTPGF